MEMMEILLITLMLEFSCFGAGVLFGKRVFGGGFGLLFLAAILALVVYMNVWDKPGTPAEMKDGIYQVRVVAVPQRSGQTDVCVLAQKEEGKSKYQYPPKYYKIPDALFAKAPRIGDELTIEIRQSPAHRELVVK